MIVTGGDPRVVVGSEAARDLERVEGLASLVQRHQQPPIAPHFSGLVRFPEHFFI